MRQELQKQRQEQLDQERRIQELMAKLANFISADSTEKQVMLYKWIIISSSIFIDFSIIRIFNEQVL